MINAHALLDTLERLRRTNPGEGTSKNTGASSTPDLLAEARHGAEAQVLQHHTDQAGNQWLVLPGASERTVLMGSHPAAWAKGDLDAAFGLAAALETLKALALRTQGHPPCTVALVSWAGNPGTALEGKASELERVAAYVELHMEPGLALEQAGAPLGVATGVRFPLGPMQTDSNRAAASADVIAFHPRLIALCDEAIRELTGTTASLPTAEIEDVAAVAKTGIPAGVMLVQAGHTSTAEQPRDPDRLHLQQAAEAFGRWTEAAMHWVAGEGVDLWAVEHRTPHSDVA